MNILTDILNLFKRKRFVQDDLKPDDVFVVGIHKEPDMEGIASPKPYKSVKLAKLSKLSSFLGKVSIREPENAPVGEYNNNSLISVAKQTSKAYGNSGLNIVNKRLILDSESTGNADISVDKTQITSNFIVTNPTHSIRLTSNHTDLVHMGSGTFNIINGYLNTIKLSGDNAKNIINFEALVNEINISDSGLTDMFNVSTTSNYLNITNSSADITNAHGLSIVINATESLTHIDNLKGINIKVSTVAQIDNYYAIYNDSSNVNAANKYFIYSDQDDPSYFEGSIEAKSFKLKDLNNTVASATAPGVTGEIRIDNNFIYFCVAPNTWKRAQLQSW